MSSIVEELKRRAKAMASKANDVLTIPLPNITEVPKIGNTFDSMLEVLTAKAEILFSVIASIEDEIKVLEEAKETRELMVNDVENLIDAIKEAKEKEEILCNAY